MGGYGSGRWGAYNRKYTVEEFRSVDINTYRRAKAARTYAFIPPGVQLALVPQARGRRYYFICPRCQRKSTKLYSPPSIDRWACRICHNLTYASAQERRKPPTAFAGFAEVLDREAKLDRLGEKAKAGKRLTSKQLDLLAREMGPSLTRERRKRRKNV